MKPSQGTIEKFRVDTMNQEEKEKIDILLTKLFIKCNINLKHLSSKALHDLLISLRPSYRAPELHEVEDQLIEKIYSQMISEVRQSNMMFGTILIECNVDCIGFLVKPRNHKVIFVQQLDGSVNLENSTSAIIKECQDLFAIKTEAICLRTSDDIFVPFESPVLLYQCLYSSAEKIFMELKDSVSSTEINLILNYIDKEYLK